ncbi:MAG: hypothetical protein AB7G93_13815 [Bdellovibrionales bacterium]
MLQRQGDLEFRTVRGMLAPCRVRGFSHLLIDDQRRNYFIEASRLSVRLNDLLGKRVEVKGLVEAPTSDQPRIHLIHYIPMDTLQRMMS